MAKRAKGIESGGSVEGAIGGFAEDLSRILGQARHKADSWLGQRQVIVKQLTQLRDEASMESSFCGDAALVNPARATATTAITEVFAKRRPIGRLDTF